jgi:hypothetical protein
MSDRKRTNPLTRSRRPCCGYVRRSATGKTGEGLDVAQLIVVEGELVVIRHPARGEFPAV